MHRSVCAGHGRALGTQEMPSTVLQTFSNSTASSFPVVEAAVVKVQADHDNMSPALAISLQPEPISGLVSKFNCESLRAGAGVAWAPLPIGDV